MPRTARQIRIEGDVAYVPLTKGYVAIIDAADVPLVEGVCWQAMIGRNTVYAVRTCGSGKAKRRVAMHRVILDAPIGSLVDHRNGDGLENRRNNLRLATCAGNNQNARIRRDNTSGLKGASWHKRCKRWQATISIDGNLKHLGYFATPELAHAAYAKVAADMHGEFARVA